MSESNPFESDIAVEMFAQDQSSVAPDAESTAPDTGGETDDSTATTNAVTSNEGDVPRETSEAIDG